MKFDFLNKNGQTLSGRLDFPSGEPKAFALFAHCFTCSKDLNVVNTISKTLTEEGIAVLRFDFTGLGSSEGEFSNTNFSSNVDDLLSACESLREKHKAPELLIGHSLGGAAALKAASMLPRVKAVATIAAPSEVKHLKKLFVDDLDNIEKEEMAEVSLAGRKFTITKQFIQDISEASILEEIKNLSKALLVLHSPIDETVSIEHAAHIFQAARHPKSFVSLDDADHLLTKKEDARYAASIIGVWAARYLSIALNRP